MKKCRLNPNIIASPLVNNFHKIYFSDRSTTLKLSGSEWSFLLSLSKSKGYFYFSDLVGINKSSKYASSSDDEYGHYLIASGILIFDDDIVDHSVSSSLALQEVGSHDSLKRKKNTPKSFDAASFFNSFNLVFCERWLKFQLMSWPVSLAVFIYSANVFYFGEASTNYKLSLTELNPVTSIFRILLMFSIVNITSVFALNILKRAIFYKDHVIIFMLKWGIFPAFITRLRPEKVQSTCSRSEGSLVFAQPILVRMYLCIISMVLLTVFIPFLASLPVPLVIVLRTLQQASILGLLFDCLPILNNSLIRLLIYNNFLQQDYLSRSYRAFIRNINLAIRVNFSQISHFWFSLFFPFSVVVVVAKIFFILTKIVPNIGKSLPPFLGETTGLIFTLAVAFPVLRFCYSRLMPRLTGISKVRQSSDLDKDIVANPSPESTDQYGQKNRLLDLFQSVKYHTLLRKRLLLIALLVLFFPFTSTLSGSAVIVEGKNVDLNSSTSGFVKNVYFEGPSDEIIKRGSLLVELESDLLSSELSANKQDIQSYKSKIKQFTNDLTSLKQGADFQSLQDLDDELVSILSQIRQTESTLIALQLQIDFSDRIVQNYEKLVEQGAASYIQYQAVKVENISLKDEASQSRQKLIQLQAKARIADRAKNLGLGLSRSENIISLEESLVQAQADLLKAQSVQKRLESEKQKLQIFMPFDGVISSSTRSLLYSSVLVGDTILSIKAIPLSSTQILIPEYERYRLEEGMTTYVRLYANPSIEYRGYISTINPSTVVQDGIKYSEAIIDLDDSMPARFIGSTGNAKVVLGLSCIANEVFRPINMFFRIDVWRYMPWV